MDDRLFYAATERNSEPIADVLSKFLPKSGNILEIASGSGEHAVHFQSSFQGIIWQASDPDVLCRKSISAWIRHCDLSSKMPEPLAIDVEKRPWPLSNEFCFSLKCVVCINMIHISPFTATLSLFEQSGELLRNGMFLFLYGPFKRNGAHTSFSNQKFDKFLKAQDPSWGVRELEEVIKIGKNNGFKKIGIFEMPANNLSVIFQKLF